MGSRREAIVFVPGTLGLVQERDYFLNGYLLEGLLRGSTQFEVQELEEAVIEGAKGKRIEVKYVSGETKIIDLYEAYWIDLVKPLSSENLKEKVIRGFGLLLYWTFSKAWWALKEAPMLLLGSTISLVLLMLWYYGTLALAFTAISENSSVLGPIANSALVKLLGHWGELMGKWSIWIIISLMLAFIPLDMAIDHIDFTKRYLQNKKVNPKTDETLQTRIHKRLLETLECVLAHKEYERVTVLAYSFGTVFATELLAAQHPFPKTIRYVTAAGPLKLLSLRSHWVQQIVQKTLRNPFISSWTDYYSERDFLCTKVPISGNTPPIFQGYSILQKASLAEAMSGEVHRAYFKQEEFINALVN